MFVSFLKNVSHYCFMRWDFPKGPFAISFEFLFIVWQFWRLIAISAIFANACISGHISFLLAASDQLLSCKFSMLELPEKSVIIKTKEMRVNAGII